MTRGAQSWENTFENKPVNYTRCNPAGLWDQTQTFKIQLRFEKKKKAMR